MGSTHIIPLGSDRCVLGCGMTLAEITEENAMKDPTPRMLEVLRALHKAHKNARGSMTGNQIGTACGFHTGHRERGPQCNHAGRVMGPAQRVIFALIGLRKRGLVDCARRNDGLSGTAYALTSRGLEFCRKHHL